MGWEKRKGGGRYYTRSRRVRGRVRREYVPLDIAHIVAELDAEERLEREYQRELKREQEAAEEAARAAFYARIFGPVDTLGAACEVVMRAELERAGYHQHKRGEWRKKRASKEEAGSRDGHSGCQRVGREQDGMDASGAASPGEARRDGR